MGDHRGTGASHRGFAYLVMVGIIWGTIGAAAKQIYRETNLDAIEVTWLRAAMASPIYLALAWRSMGKEMFAATRRDQAVMILLGVVLIFYQWLYLAAVDRLGLTSATLIALCVPPALIAFVSTVVLREHLTTRIAIALAGALAGILLLVGWQSDSADEHRSMTSGVFLALASAGLIATHVMGSRVVGGRHDALKPLAIGFPVGVVIFLPIALRNGLTLDIPLIGWLLLLYLAVVPSVIGYWLYQRGLQHVTATTASIVTLLEPLVAAVIGWTAFGEQLGVIGWIGGVLLMGAIALLALSSPRTSEKTAEEVALG